MLKTFPVFCRFSVRTMSKKFKSESIKKTAQLSNTLTENSEVLPLEKVKNMDLQKPEYSFQRIPMKPVKSPNDKKEYSVIKLENGLLALLIHDPSAAGRPIISDLDNEEKTKSNVKMIVNESDDESDSESSSCGSDDDTLKEEKLAACALTVGVGSFSDPSEVPGMAHFIEHMIFMGSQKYPEENYFDSFIKKKGGSDNASTECESTTYYFECPDENMSTAMEIFSNLFASPLMTESAMVREREAVESEFVENLPNDQYRRQQLLMSCACPDNPAGKFVWGNLKTLKENISDNFLHNSTHTFWKNHYSADKMAVAVQARLPLETLERMVSKHFSQVPRNLIQSPPKTLPQEAFDMSKFHKLYYVTSIRDVINLELSWVMPPIKDLYRTKPTNYLSFTLGHEGKGSLMSYLRKRHWATSLSAGHDDDDLSSNEMYSIFAIGIVLTELGAKNISSILNSVFDYIKLLQKSDPSENIFNEIKSVAELNFRFEEEIPAADYTEALSGNMREYPIENWLNIDTLFEYSPDQIKQFLNCLSPDTVNIMISRKDHEKEITMDEVEPWFQTKYTTKAIPDSWKRGWSKGEPDPELHLPESNPFIATNFALYHEGKSEVKYPEKILSSDNLSVWYKPDTKFKLPLGSINLQCVNKITSDSKMNCVLLQMYSDLLNHFLIEELYPANMALLDYKIRENRFLLIEINGFNEKLNIILKKIAECINTFNELLTEEILDMYKEARLKAYYNNNFNVKYLGRELRFKLTLENFFTSIEKYNITRQVNKDLIKNFSDNYFKNTEVQCLVQGNILKEDALLICKNFANSVIASPLKDGKPQHRVYELPNSDSCFKVKSFDKQSANCATVNFYQVGPVSAKEWCAVDLLMLLMEESLFDQLRTQEQLGYDTSCSIRELYGTIGFVIHVVSQIDKQSIEHVEERITHFLQNYLESLKKMPLDDFNQVVKSLIALKQCCDLHLKEEVNRNWTEIINFDYSFNRLEQQQAILAKITPEDVIELLQRFTNPKNPKFRKLTLQVEGYLQNDNESKDSQKETTLPESLEYTLAGSNLLNEDKIVINDIEGFKSKLSFFPENKIFQ